MLLFFIPGGHNVAFLATMTPITGCLGPFNKNVSISYCNVTLNQGYGYNPALGEQFKIFQLTRYFLNFR